MDLNLLIASAPPDTPKSARSLSETNQQSSDSLRGCNYWAESDTRVHLSGRICGAAAEGPGALFDRFYGICSPLGSDRGAQRKFPGRVNVF
jgi:hypothetical protein